MTGLGIDAAEQWLTRAEETIERLTKDPHDHAREIAEYQKMLARFKRALSQSANRKAEQETK